MELAMTTLVWVFVGALIFSLLVAFIGCILFLIDFFKR